jgi:hypothetical protein
MVYWKVEDSGKDAESSTFRRKTKRLTQRKNPSSLSLLWFLKAQSAGRGKREGACGTTRFVVDEFEASAPARPA